MSESRALAAAVGVGRVSPILVPMIRSIARRIAPLWGGLALAAMVASCSGTPTPAAAATAPMTPTACVGTLHVETEPPGADVMLDGVALGPAPLTTSVGAGRHVLGATREGLADARQAVDASCGEIRLRLTLADVTAPAVHLGALPTIVRPEEVIAIVATAEDNVAVASLSLTLDGMAIAASSSPSLQHSLDARTLAPGAHTLAVAAVDAAGLTATTSASFAVLAATVSPTASPAITATSPPTPTLMPTGVPTPAPTRRPAPTAATPVEAVWTQITVDAYAYEQALYTDPSVGHPYPLLHADQVGPPRPRTFRALVLRNAYLEMTLLPELGGRIYSLRLVPTGQELLYQSRAIKPTHWGPTDQGWWLAAGGMEWCLPVDEHGYLTAEPWEATLTRRQDGGVTVVMSIVERTRNLQAKISITLLPGEAAVHLRPSIRNLDAQQKSFQFWINAMVSPGSHGIQPSLRFYVPADHVVVHSRAESALPDAQQTLSWPIYQGRDLSRYAAWRDYLGFFAPDLAAPYTAVYEESAQVGLVRAFPRGVARGAKIFAFGPEFGANGLYADDGAQYAEMWGGLTPTFWDYYSLAGDAEVAWNETWYVIAGCGGLSYANAQAALYLRAEAGALNISVAAAAIGRWTLTAWQGEVELLRTNLEVQPGRPWAGAADLAPGNPTGPVLVRIVDAVGDLVLAYTWSSTVP